MNSQPDTICYPPHLPESFEALTLPVDKPAGWSSFDVIRRLRRILQVRKIGHAGTLDPMATGLLICLVGRATKQMQRFMELPKKYTGTLRLGEETDTYDAEGTVTRSSDWESVDDQALAAAVEPFRGEISQRTPMYSAVKVGGERLYRKARRGESVERPLRSVVVHRFDITGRDGPLVSFEVDCSKGTYVRALAHDLGLVLGCGAHLIALRRTAIGDITVERAWTLPVLGASVEARREGAA